jgi:hypothetical protein
MATVVGMPSLHGGGTINLMDILNSVLGFSEQIKKKQQLTQLAQVLTQEMGPQVIGGTEQGGVYEPPGPGGITVQRPTTLPPDIFSKVMSNPRLSAETKFAALKLLEQFQPQKKEYLEEKPGHRYRDIRTGQVIEGPPEKTEKEKNLELAQNTIVNIDKQIDVVKGHVKSQFIEMDLDEKGLDKFIGTMPMVKELQKKKKSILKYFGMETEEKVSEAKQKYEDWLDLYPNATEKEKEKAANTIFLGKEIQPKIPPSAGNAVDLAIKRKFGTEYLTDPQKAIEADKWLATEDGRKEVQKARDDLTPPAIGVIQTEGGIKTIGTRGEGMGQIKETGQAPPLSEDFKKDYTAIGQANDLVSELKNTWNSLDIETGMSGRLKGTKLYLAAKTGQNPDAKLYLDNREAFLGNLSRSLAAERGVLTQQDIERIAKAIPRIGANFLNSDSKEEAAKKWASIFSLIENAEKRMGERAKMRTEKPSPIRGEKTQTQPGSKFKILKVE